MQTIHLLVNAVIDFLQSDTPASNLQSFEQLGVAASLTFLIAGPTVRSLLQGRMTDMAQTHATLATLIDAQLPMTEELRLRQETLDLFNRLIEQSMKTVAPQTPATTLFYIGMCACHLALLTFSSFAEKIPNKLALIAVLLSALTVLMDPVRVWHRAKLLEKIAGRIHKFVVTLSATVPSAERAKQIRKSKRRLGEFAFRGPVSVPLTRRNNASIEG